MPVRLPHSGIHRLQQKLLSSDDQAARLQIGVAMPSDDYTAVGGGGGALKLKGAKVTKKKKKSKDKSDLEKNIGAGGSGKGVAERGSLPREEPEEHGEGSTKTESERRHDELKKKRVYGNRPLKTFS
jgi:protein FAM32A